MLDVFGDGLKKHHLLSKLYKKIISVICFNNFFGSIHKLKISKIK